MKEFRKFVFDIRNLLSLSAMVVFMTLSLTGRIPPELSMTIITMVFAYFLGRSSGKSEAEAEANIANSKPPDLKV